MISTLLVSLLVSVFFILSGVCLSTIKWAYRYSVWIKSTAVLLALPSLFLACYLLALLLAPHPKAHRFDIGEGIHYSRTAQNFQHHKAVVHLAKIDLQKVELELSALPAKRNKNKNSASLTTTALLANNANFAINASYFSPFNDTHIFDYYPHIGDPVFPIGQTIVDGVLYGQYEKAWPKLVIYKNGEVDILDEVLTQQTIAKITDAISGRRILVKNGVIKTTETTQPYPRTAIGLSQDKRFLYGVVVDGKQPGYSAGMTLHELATYFATLNVDTAIELDGGGSSTMAWLNLRGEAELLNRPAHTKIPNRERPVVNHVLVRNK